MTPFHQSQAVTPMMQQYLDIKARNADSILFFRLGDFYEIFYDDAKLVSREFDLTLMSKDCGGPDRAPMCGIPYHSADTYIGRLIALGHKVVIVEEVITVTAKGRSAARADYIKADYKIQDSQIHFKI